VNHRKRVGFFCLLVLALVSPTRPSAAQPVVLDDVIVFAEDQVRLSTNARHTSGQIVVNSPQGVATIHPLFKTVPNLAPQLIANAIDILPYLGATGPELFDVFTNGINDPNSALNVQGTLTTPMGFSLPLFPFPAPPAVTPGTTTIRVRRTDSPVTLPPGDYGLVRVYGNGVLYLEGGVYNIKSLRVGSRGQLLANGTTTINVSEKVRFLGRTNFGPADPELNGRCLVLNTPWARTLAFGRFSDVTAVVNAPAAHVRLGKLGTYRGNFTAKRVTVGRSAVLETLSPLSEACP
jgi:hypothetical protein